MLKNVEIHESHEGLVSVLVSVPIAILSITVLLSAMPVGLTSYFLGHSAYVQFGARRNPDYESAALTAELQAHAAGMIILYGS